jgi:hypothetical protein
MSQNSLSDQELFENNSYVLQLDVEDSESKDEYQDLLLLTSSGVGFLPQNTVGKNKISELFIANEFKSIHTDGTLRVLASDFRNSGASDLIDLSSIPPHIRYFKNINGARFEKNSTVSKNLQVVIDESPSDGDVCDIDDDGDLDLIITVGSKIKILLNQYEYNSSVRDQFVPFEKTISHKDENFYQISEDEDILQVVVSDVDGDYDLDLVLLQSSRVLWYENITDRTGETPKLKFSDVGHVMVGQDLGITDATVLESYDSYDSNNTKSLDPFHCRDFLVGAANGIFRINRQAGTYDTPSVPVKVATLGADADGVFQLKPVVFSEQLQGYVYSTNSGNLFYSKEMNGLGSGISDISSRAITVFYREGGGADLLVSDKNEPKIHYWQLEDNGFNSDATNSIDLPTNEVKDPVIGMSFVDLNRVSSFLDYDLTDPAEVFDKVRLRLDGRLFFKDKEIPDYENPKGTGNGTSNSNFYEARIKVSQATNPQIMDQRTVVVRIKDENEPPEFVSLPPELDHHENVLKVLEINAINPEPLQEIKFEIKEEDDKDGHLFDLTEINGAAANLVFKKPPDFDETKNITPYYELTLRVYEVGDSGMFAEHNLTISLDDGYELPVLNPVNLPVSDNIDFWELNTSDFSLIIDAVEDFSEPYVLNLTDFNASDTNNEVLYGISGPPIDIPKNTQLGIDPSKWRISQEPIGGESWIEGGQVYYKLNPNFYGTDHFKVAVSNYAGHTVEQKLVFRIPNIPDDPIINLPSSFTCDEGNKTILLLDGYDPDILDSNQSGSWRLNPEANQTFVIKNINGRQELHFRDMPDFENLNGDSGHQTKFTINLTLESEGKSVNRDLTIHLGNKDDEIPRSILFGFDQKNPLDLNVSENLNSLINLEVNDPDGLSKNFIVRIEEDSPDHKIGGKIFKIAEYGNGEFYLETVNSAGLDFESPEDGDRNNLYHLIVYVGEKREDGNEYGATYHLNVKVLNVDEIAPEFIDGPGDLSLSILENRNLEVQIKAKDEAENEIVPSPLNYSVSGGIDQELFFINESDGSLIFKELPNFEIPRDYNGNNEYEVEISVSDGTNLASKTIFIKVEDANDPPHVVNPFHQGTEDKVYNGGLAFADEDGDPVNLITYNLPREENSSLVLYEDFSFTYTPPADFDSTDIFTVTLADPYTIATPQIEISLAPVNDPPVAEDDYVNYTDLKKSNRLQFNVLKNDHGGVDKADENYTLISHTQTDYTAGLTNLGAGNFAYTPSFGFLGEDTFTYVMADQNDLSSMDTGTVRIWIAKTSSLPDWTYLRHFGAYMESRNGWIYHERLGWIYARNPQKIITDSTWIWSEYIGWFWTGEKYFNYVYAAEQKKWLQWQGNLTNSNSWFLRDENNTIYNKDFFDRQAIRKRVNEILPDLEKLSDYISQNHYFSRGQIITILTELNRYKLSSTLNQILEFDFQY